MTKIIHITGFGVGKTFIAELMMQKYAAMQVNAVLKILLHETPKEAAKAISDAADADVLILVGRACAETLGCHPWQTIDVSGGRPIFEARRLTADSN